MLLECGQCAQASLLKLADPALRNVVERHRIEEMELLAPCALPGDQVRFVQDRQVFRDRLPRHVQSPTELAQCLPVAGMQTVQQFAATGVGESAKHGIVIHSRNTEPCGYLYYRQPNGSLSRDATISSAARERTAVDCLPARERRRVL